MKLIICILKDDDKDAVTRGLSQAGIGATVLPSTGAYFRRGNATLMVGVEDENVDPAIEVIKNSCAPPVEAEQKRATVFVLNVDRFEKV